MYIETFTLPVEREEDMLEEKARENGGPQFGYVDNIYPCRMFGSRELKDIRFQDITIFYGSNGSGKSTLLNLIAKKLNLIRIAPFNSGEMFDRYAEACEYTCGHDKEGFIHRIPDGSRIITSDDIFDYMLTVRTNNAEIAEHIEAGKEEHYRLKYGETLKLNGLEDYEAFRMHVLAKKKSVTRRQFIRRTAGMETKLSSNGETALQYFETKLKNNRLYCLDEPENSMAPTMQIELKQMLEEYALKRGCQFIIATHSPFLLAIEGARIYDLDYEPVVTRNWWDLDNVRTYYEFFRENEKLFWLI